jgi:hypothetical protein
MNKILVKKENLIKLGNEILPHILERKGELIYSSHETLKKGDIYLLGLNPGGEDSPTIKKHLEGMLQKKTNSYLDESWRNKITTWEKGQAPLQKRVNYLLNSLGHKTREVCSSNLIFVMSRSADEINYGLAGYCWRFHEVILEIIQPKIILCFGISDISAYSFLLALFNETEVKPFPADHGDWHCRAFNTVINGRKTTIVGVPHLSYYNIIGKEEVINWIKSL